MALSRALAVHKGKKDVPLPPRASEPKEIQANEQLHRDLEVTHGWRLCKKHG